MPSIRIVDVTDLAAFRLVPPCADPGFDHRSCDYWEDGDKGSKAARLSWLPAAEAAGSAAAPAGSAAAPAPKPKTGNPFLDDLTERTPQANPFASGGSTAPANPFATAARSPAFNPFAQDDDAGPLADNPFAPRPKARPTVGSDAPHKLQLLDRGLGVFGSFAKVLLVDDRAAAYCQFGPLTAYPRAQRLRDLYPQLPASPLPAVITCIAATPEARGQGWAARLVTAVCGDLAGRGFSAIEAYPERRTRPDATSAATPEFWLAAGFTIAVADERYPVLRRELG